MKLLRLKLYEPYYRSLQFDEQKFPKLPYPLIKGTELDPICLVGLNGSGKSNLLEFIADIFYLIESELLDYKVASPKPYTPFSDNKNRKEIYFEIDYKLKVDKNDTYIRIVRLPKSKQARIFKFENEKFDKTINEIKFDIDCRKYLPLVVAYTSGLNDLLSMPFIELQDYYAREVTHQVNGKEPNYDAIVTDPCMMLMDFDSNAAIILSNFLLNGNKTIIFKEFMRVQGLNSFKIVIQLNKGSVHLTDFKVKIPNEFKEIIENLVNCSTVQKIVESEKGNVYELDYLINDATIKLFRFYFKTPKKLFSDLSKLNLLNTLRVEKPYRNKLRSQRAEGKLLRFPTVASLDKIFRIEQIELILSNPKVRTEYMKISDGEHQFIHIVGGLLLFDEADTEREVLYLLDEPDTHFNPVWRNEFFSELDKVLENKNHEIILTTHSPFILGDCHGYNVFKFERNPLTNIVSFKRSEHETFGTNFNFLLKNMFDFDSQLTDKSKKHLMILEKKIQEIDNLSKDQLVQIETELKLYGESIEKLLVINQLEKLKEQFKLD